MRCTVVIQQCTRHQLRFLASSEIAVIKVASERYSCHFANARVDSIGYIMVFLADTKYGVHHEESPLIAYLFPVKSNDDGRHMLSSI